MDRDTKRFGIYHPIDGKVNKACDMINMSYEYITSLDTENFVRTFYMGQSKLNPEYAKLGKRDTTVGDLITEGEKIYMVLDNGLFRRVPKTKDLYKRIMEIDEAIIEILSRRTLTEDDVNKLMDNCF